MPSPKRDRSSSGSLAAAIGRWPIWDLPRPVVGGLLAVEFLAVGIVALTARLGGPYTSRTLLWFTILVGCAIAHIELSRSIDRLREKLSEGRPWWNLQAVWSFAALLVLPPLLVAVLIGVTYTYTRLRLPRIQLYRWVYTTAVVILASTVAKASIIGINPANSVPLTTWSSTLAVLVGGTVRWLVNVALVGGVIIATSPATPSRRALGRPADHLVESACLALGAAITVLLNTAPLSVPLLLLPVLAIHRGMLLAQAEAAARTDPRTKLLNPTFWREFAEREWQHAHRTATSLGLLLVDVDNLASVNTRHGRAAGDRALRAIADLLRKEFRQSDCIGRLGGEEFVVLLAEVSTDELRAAADLVCARVRNLGITAPDGTVIELTVSVGAARYPDVGSTLEQLLYAADNAMFAAKDAGRDRASVIRVATRQGDPPLE
jgi:diguanylate cyclase (GGDEF)-like protein